MRPWRTMEPFSFGRPNGPPLWWQARAAAIRKMNGSFKRGAAWVQS